MPGESNVMTLPVPSGGSLPDRFLSLAHGPLERALGLTKLEQLYRKAVRLHTGGTDFALAALQAMGITIDLAAGGLASVPREGPLVVVANHPFGGVEGIVLLALLGSVRPDAKVLANYMLQRIPELSAHCIYVNPFGGPHAPRRNVGPLRDALSWLQAGHVLVCFPAGAVSHLHVRRGCVCDPPWSPHVGRLIRRSGADVVPVSFAGHNGALFQLLGLLHARCRTLLLPRAFCRMENARVKAHVGFRIPFGRVERVEDDASLMDYLRFRCDFPDRTVRLATRRNRRGRPRVPAVFPVARPGPREELAAEVAELPRAALLAENDRFRVFMAKGRGIPGVLREIGRLREMTFRAMGEGTGGAVDRDRFDDYYHHLFLWHKPSRRIAGAYRMTRADRVLAEQGPPGLYTNTLFRFDPRFWDGLGPSWELGRSFVCRPFQRTPGALALLWKGIARVLLRDPHRCTLFGPVSIDNVYRPASRELMAAFLGTCECADPLARFVSARNPFRLSRLARGYSTRLDALGVDVRDVSELVARVEDRRRGIPVLLRHYLRLGGRALGLSVDPAFGNVLDALIRVDLREADPHFLSRFMGRDGARQFFACHS